MRLWFTSEYFSNEKESRFIKILIQIVYLTVKSALWKTFTKHNKGLDFSFIIFWCTLNFSPNFCVFFLISQVCEISGIVEEQFN